jgi:ribosomal protein S18 acetylase RimI-like enzyme
VPVFTRLATAAEYAAAGEICVAAYRESGQLGDDSGYAEELADVAARASDGDVLVAVDTDSGEVLGTVTLALHGSPLAELAGPGEAEFRMLAVAPTARRRGVGTRLTGACIERAAGHRCSALVMYVRDFNAPAREMYAALGFRETPERNWSFSDTGHLVAMRLDLPA